MPPRPRERTGNDSDEYVKKSFELMLSTLRDQEANPRRTPQRPAILNSGCLLPDCRSQNQSPLSIDTRTAHYHCNACEASGTPTTYMARLWRVSASNAHALIEHYDLDELRNGRPKMTAEMLETRQDSYPLLLAMQHFSAQVEGSYNALRWMTKMELEPQMARRLGIGYCSGEGLREALQAEHIDEDQMSATGLFLPATGGERFAGRIVLADYDHTGAVTWLISADPSRDTAIPGYRIAPNPPGITALPTQGRSALLGLHRSYDRTKPTLLTDDLRAYTGAVAHGAQAILIVRRPRREEPDALRHRMDIMAETVARRTRSSALIIATHHSQLSAGLRDRLERALPDTPLLAVGKSTTLRIASPATRNFATLFDQETMPQRAISARATLDAHPMLSQNGAASDDPAAEAEDTTEEGNTP